MNDIYIELKNVAKENNLVVFESQRNSRASDLQLLQPEFMQKVDKIQYLMSKVRKNNESIVQILTSHKKVVSPDKEKQLREIIDKFIQENEKNNFNIKELLKNLQSQVESNVQNAPDEPETSAQINIQQSLHKELIQLLQQGQDIQDNFRQFQRSRIRRQVELLDNDISEKEKEDICDHPEKLHQMMAKMAFNDVPSQLNYAVQDIVEKNNEVIKLEQSVTRVHQMFIDIALFVKQQGEDLDNIEANLMKAQDYVIKADKELVIMKETHKSKRNKMCCIIAIGAIILLIIIVPIAIKNYK